MVSHYDQSNWAVHWSAGVLQLYVQRQCTSQPGRTSVTLDQLHSSHCGTRSGQPSCIFNIVSGVISAFASPVWAPRRNAPLIPFFILNIVCLFISYASPLVFFLHFFLTCFLLNCLRKNPLRFQVRCRKRRLSPALVFCVFILCCSTHWWWLMSACFCCNRFSFFPYQAKSCKPVDSASCQPICAYVHARAPGLRQHPSQVLLGLL